MGENWLRKPEWFWNPPEGERDFVHQWVRPLEQGEGEPDLILFGAPMSRSSISVSGASLYPQEFRKMWKSYATYNLDEDLDLTPFHVADAGDVAMHTTNISESHKRIQESCAYLSRQYPETALCMIGGDHSTTACAVRGIKETFPEETIGIVQLDTHLDVRDPTELGPANGTPIRQLIDGGVVKGDNVYNIGLHGYFNARPLISYAKEKKIRMVTLKQAREKGVPAAVNEAIDRLSEEAGIIYVTVDMDVLDITQAPGVPASTPGGMTTAELFGALMEIGKREEVRYIDFVCLDPTKDSAVSETVKAGVYAWMQFVTGRVMRSGKG